MTKFNPLNKEILTYKDCLSPAMKITDEEDAQQYLADYVVYLRDVISRDNNKTNKDGKTVEEIASSNIGYYAGYYDDETRDRVERLFKCKHPVFGAIAEQGAPTVQEALEAGIRAVA